MRGCAPLCHGLVVPWLVRGRFGWREEIISRLYIGLDDSVKAEISLKKVGTFYLSVCGWSLSSVNVEVANLLDSRYY